MHDRRVPHRIHRPCEGDRLIAFTILGEPASKANSRELVTRGGKTGFIEEIDEQTGEKVRRKAKVGGRPMFIKSDKALAYERDALRQIPPSARMRLEGPVRMTLRVFYATERPDLDESIILDVLQDRYEKDKKTNERVLVQKGVYRNDRQVREKHVFHAIDKRNPRAEIEIEPMVAQQPDFLEVQELVLAEDEDPF